MPEVKNEKGEVIANMPYNQAGEQQAQKMVAQNPGYTVNDASQRSTQTYAGGGMTGYNVPMYKHCGKSKTMEHKYNKPKMSEEERLAGLEKLGKLAKAKKSKMKKTGKKKKEKTLAEKEGLRHGSGELPPDSGRE